MSTPYTMKLQSPDWDGHTFTDAAMVNGSANLNSPAQVGFIAADIGLPVVVYGAGALGVPLVTTITGYVDAYNVTLGLPAATSVTNAAATMGHGSEISLPVTTDTLSGNSMAAIIALFEGENQIFDFAQLSEMVKFGGFFSVDSAVAAGFVNPIQMRDEMRRTRGTAPHAGRNLTATPISWLDEGGTGGNWGVNTLPAVEQDASTNRALGRVRVILDEYWNPVTANYAKLFMYGTVMDYQFGPRPGATTKTRIPWALTFAAGSVKLG